MIILISLIFLAFLIFIYSQNKITLKNQSSFIGNIAGFYRTSLVFKHQIPGTNTDRLDIREDISISGSMPEFRQKVILKKNPNITFLDEDYSKEDFKIKGCNVDKQGRKDFTDPLYYQPFNQNKSVTNLSAGDYLNRAGNHHMIGL